MTKNKNQENERLSIFLSAVNKDIAPPDEEFLNALQEKTTTRFLSSSVEAKTQTTIIPFLWRIIMKKPITKFATAAAILLIITSAVTILDHASQPAYAIEQTIEASHSVRYLHAKYYNSIHEEPKEFWMEFDGYGKVKNVRLDFPEWAGEGDGAKLIIWKADTVDIWFKRKKSLLRMPDKTVADHMLKMVEMFDPKGMLERLQSQNLDGLAKIEIEQPSNKSKPIVITATFSPEKSIFPGQRGVLFIDQDTKLVTHIEHYQLEGEKYKYSGKTEFHDYNQRINPEMFSLSEAPSDLLKIDYTTQEIGIPQGNLTDQEIAVKAVREFYEALIAKNYTKAGQIYSGIPAAKIQEQWQNINVLRIVSISEPAPHPMAGVGGFQVHCEIEIEKDGIKSILKPYGPGVRPVHGQSHRWNIHGGVK